jgi:hypothetical protein
LIRVCPTTEKKIRDLGVKDGDKSLIRVEGAPLPGQYRLRGTHYEINAESAVIEFAERGVVMMVGPFRPLVH